MLFLGSIWKCSRVDNFMWHVNKHFYLDNHAFIFIIPPPLSPTRWLGNHWFYSHLFGSSCLPPTAQAWRLFCAPYFHLTLCMYFLIPSPPQSPQNRNPCLSPLATHSKSSAETQSREARLAVFPTKRSYSLLTMSYGASEWLAFYFGYSLLWNKLPQT